MIKRFYYSVWSDCILKMQSVSFSKKSWKFYSLLLMSMCMAMNFMFIMGLIQNKRIGLNYFYKLNIDIFPGNKLDAFVSFFILFLLPMLIINYLLVFRKNQYQIIINRGKKYDGKLFFKYFLASLWIPVILVLLGMMYFKIIN